MTVPAINLSDSGVNKEVAVPYVFVNLSNIYFYVWATGGYRYVSTDPNPIYFKNFEYVDVSCLATSFNRTESDTFVERVNDTTIRWSDGTAGTIAQTTTFGTIKGWTKAYSVNLASDSATNVVTYPNLPNITSSSISTSPLGTNLAVGVTLTAGYTGSLIWRYRVDSATYQWVRGSSSTGPWTNISGATSSNYSLTSSDVGYFISCTITGINHRGTTSVTPSGVFLFAAPTGLSSSNITSTTATISWSSLTGATGYQYAYGTSTNPTNWSSTITATTANLTGLVANTKYYFAVRAVRNTDTGPASTSVSFNTLFSKPTVTANVDLGSIGVTYFGRAYTNNTFSWGGGGNPGYLVNGSYYYYYTVQYATWNAATSTLGTWQNSNATVAILSTATLGFAYAPSSINGNTYKFRTAVVDNLGNVIGEWSDPSNAVSPFNPPSAPAPTGLSVTSGADATNGIYLTLNWNANSVSSTVPVLGWAVSRNGGSSWVRYTTASVSSHTFTNLTANTSYTLIVKALVGTVDTTGTAPNRPIDYATDFSIYSGSQTATTATTPGSIATLTLTPNVSSGFPVIDASWSAAASGGATVSYEWSLNNSTWYNAGSSTSTTITGLGLGTTYTVYVRAKNYVGVGPTKSGTATTLNVPGAPSVPAGGAMSGVSGSNATVTFSYFTAPSNGGSTITGYEGKITTASSPSFTGTITPTSGNYFSPALSINPATKGGTYYPFVRAKNALGWGPSSPNNYIITTPNVPSTPSAPKNTRPSSTINRVSWTAPANNGSSITSYILYRSQNASTWNFAPGYTNGNVGNVTQVDVTATAGTTYYFAVVAVNALGNSGQSAASAKL